MVQPLQPRSISLLLLFLGVVLWFAWSLSADDSKHAAASVEARDRVTASTGSAPDLAAVGDFEVEQRRAQAAPDPKPEAQLASQVDAERGVLHGRVVDPAKNVAAGALVGLVSLHEGIPGHRGDREVVVASESGEFELSVPAWARDANVLLIARRKGMQPHSEIVVLDRAFLERDHELALGVGHEISGRVIRDGIAVPEARVSVDVAHGTGGIFDAGSEAWWANGRLEEKHGDAHTAADGSFRITGMGPYDHRVEVHADQRDCPRVAGHLFTIEAPDSRVYDLTGARVAVTVTDRNGPVSGAQIHVSSGGHGVIVESADGPVEVEVPAHATVSIDVSHPLSRPVRTQLESAAAGQRQEVVLPLDSVSRPSMTVVVPGATRAGIDRLRLRMQLTRGFSDTEHEATATGGVDTFSVPVVALDPGHYNLILEPNGRDGAGRYITPRAKEIHLPSEGDLHAEFDLELSGRCDARITSPFRGEWSARHSILDSAGDTCFERHTFHAAPRSGEAIEWDEDVSEPDIVLESLSRHGRKFHVCEDAAAVARRCGVLPAGVYTLTVDSHGHARWTSPITIEPGKTTRVDVTLTRND